MRQLYQPLRHRARSECGARRLSKRARATSAEISGRKCVACAGLGCGGGRQHLGRGAGNTINRDALIPALVSGVNPRQPVPSLAGLSG
jgi:hypothetical protein